MRRGAGGSPAARCRRAACTTAHQAGRLHHDAAFTNSALFYPRARGPAKTVMAATPWDHEFMVTSIFFGADTARRALASLGVEALPALQKGRQSAADPEVRRRLDELIPSLERAAILMPRLVSLHMTNKPVRDVLNELTRQTGYKFADWPDNPAPGTRDKLVYTFQFDKLPFWEAFDKISEASGLALQQQGYWPDDALHVYR